jgi:hypothetical protein
MPVSNKTSSNADVVTSSKTGKDLEGEKDQTSSGDISEDMIKEAIEKRASYFRKNSEYVSSTSRLCIIIASSCLHQWLPCVGLLNFSTFAH